MTNDKPLNQKKYYGQVRGDGFDIIKEDLLQQDAVLEEYNNWEAENPAKATDTKKLLYSLKNIKDLSHTIEFEDDE